MRYWNLLTIDGKDVPLQHLEPFRFKLKTSASLIEYIVEVRFNNHCFTEKYDPAKHNSILPLSHGDKNEDRAFSKVRYSLSLRLPEIIRGLSGKRIAQTRKGALVRLTLEDGVDYAFFFNLRKSGTRICEMFIVSAYPLDAGQRRKIIATGEMKFEIAVCRTMQGKPTKFPPRQKRNL